MALMFLIFLSWSSLKRWLFCSFHRKEMIMDMDIVFASNLVVEFKVVKLATQIAINTFFISLKVTKSFFSFQRWKGFLQRSRTLASEECWGLCSNPWWKHISVLHWIISPNFDLFLVIHVLFVARSARYLWLVGSKRTFWRYSGSGFWNTLCYLL